MGRDGMEAVEELGVRTYEPGDEHVILEMFERVFGHRRTLEEWRWQFREAPEGPAVIHVLEDRGSAIGHIAHVPVAVWVAGRRLRLGRGCDTMVLPEYRGHGGMKRLVQGFLEADHGFDLRMNFPNERAAVLMPRYGGGPLLGRVPKWVRLLARPKRLGLPGRVVPGGLLRLYGGLASRPAPRVPVEPLRELGAEVDELAAESARFAPCIRIRDAAYLRWRWLERPGASSTIVAARRAETLRGFAVLQAHDSDLGRRGRIADALATDAEVLRALLCQAARLLAGQGCDRVVCDYQDPRPWARRAFLRSGFLPLRGDLDVVCRALSEQAGTSPERLQSWYLTRGDSDLA
jgi:hypothetical protein